MPSVTVKVDYGVGQAISNRPTQPAGIVYGTPTGLGPYSVPGGLVVAGRDNYNDQRFKSMSAGGGTVLIYLDAVIDNSYGRYHDKLMNPSEFGPATGLWPGNYQVNEWGKLGDFRVGSVLQSKLEGVLELMVAENPHMGGFFLDDLGSRSWFPGFNWGSWSASQKKAYRDGAIAVAKTVRKVADRHGLIFMVNGTWTANDGGGYPVTSKHGLSLTEGGFVENHDGQIAFFGPYAASTQWASATRVGKSFMFAVVKTAAGLTEFRNSGSYAFVAKQTDYGTVSSPWGPFHPTGLPSKVRGT